VNSQGLFFKVERYSATIHIILRYS